MANVRKMAKPRIHIIGGPGSGKSFVAAELSSRLGVATHDLDDLFWHRSASRYGIRADPADRDRELAAIVAQDGWVIEGVYYGWLAPSFDAADIIIELTPSSQAWPDRIEAGIPRCRCRCRRHSCCCSSDRRELQAGGGASEGGPSRLRKIEG
jgi:hypothetical protein